MRVRGMFFTATAAALLMAAPAAASTSTVTVDTTADEYGTGASCSLREAVQTGGGISDFGGCVRVPADIGSVTILLPTGVPYELTRDADDDDNNSGDLDILGGITIQPIGSGTAEIRSSTIGGNRVFDVIGVHSLTLNHVDVSGGVTLVGPDGDGGGIRSAGELFVNQSTIRDNGAGNGGGGISNVHGSVSILNSTLEGNSSAGGSGGAIENIQGTVVIANSTITHNDAGIGGGVVDFAPGPESGTVISNSIVAGNTATESSPDCNQLLIGPHAFVSQGYNLIGSSAGCNFTPAAGDKRNVSPRLGPLNPGTRFYPLLSTSPAVNAGNPAGAGAPPRCAPVDQLGVARPRGGRCDIGAIESPFAAAKKKCGKKKKLKKGKCVKRKKKKKKKHKK